MPLFPFPLPLCSPNTSRFCQCYKNMISSCKKLYILGPPPAGRRRAVCGYCNNLIAFKVRFIPLPSVNYLFFIIENSKDNCLSKLQKLQCDQRRQLNLCLHYLAHLWCSFIPCWRCSHGNSCLICGFHSFFFSRYGMT